MGKIHITPAAEGGQMPQKGRPRALTEPEIAEAKKLYWEECLPVRMIADAMSVSHMTVWRAVCAPPQLQAGQEN
ncbi:MAG: helix-turn-helix domain-containing protein [Candidatus Micrarchaeia archaeon]